MKTILLGFGLFALSIGYVHGQVISESLVTSDSTAVDDDSLNVSFVAYWEEDDTRTFDVCDQKKKWKNDVLEKNDSTVVRLNMTVTQATDSSYTIRWMPVDGTTSVDQEEVDKYIDQNAMATLMNQGLIYRTSEMGEYQALENRGVLVQTFIAGLDSAFAFADTIQVKERKELFDAWRKPDFIVDIATMPIQLYHQYYGYWFLVGHSSPVTKSFPNRWGGDPFPAAGFILVDDVDTLRKEVTLTIRVDVDSTANKEIMADLLRKLTGKREDEIQQYVQNLEIEFYQEEKYRFDYELGWVKSMEWRRVYASEGTRQENRYTIKMVGD